VLLSDPHERRPGTARRVRDARAITARAEANLLRRVRHGITISLATSIIACGPSMREAIGLPRLNGWTIECPSLRRSNQS